MVEAGRGTGLDGAHRNEGACHGERDGGEQGDSAVHYYLPKTGICHQEVRTARRIFLKVCTYGYSGATFGIRLVAFRGDRWVTLGS
ncbi:hypothetical protein GCM10012278_18290 [Nonomuraea glycinis]|uniref:Uncharacterized protein n=1 Tax=Nonomuraea glycinis TaxID=2047744 RepID=A0A918E3J1_9ACTN|nr:hypothetical protein GCM10012278_18290 [Nonomuraea glycinis]